MKRSEASAEALGRAGLVEAVLASLPCFAFAPENCGYFAQMSGKRWPFFCALSQIEISIE